MKITLGEKTAVFRNHDQVFIGFINTFPKKKICLCGCGETFRPYIQGKKFKSKYHFDIWKENKLELKKDETSGLNKEGRLK